MTTANNTGDRDGDEVVMLFAAPPSADLSGAPLRHLLDFKRVHVIAGQKCNHRVRFTHLAFFFC
jgi:hypothetical protein